MIAMPVYLVFTAATLLASSFFVSDKLSKPDK